jgi:hypothetical protein
MAQDRRGAGRAQAVGVVDAVTPGQQRMDQSHGLDPDVGPAGRLTQIHTGVEQFPQAQMLGQGGRGEQPSVGHRVLVVEGHRQPVQTVAR